MTNSYNGQLVFGLDIGTRSIVGTVGYKIRDRFVVVAQRVKEHETRAMLDGQIHDIGKVGESIRIVKEELEAAIGRKLTEVCIAAAGRVLKTVTTHVETAFETDKEVLDEDIYSLTAAGIEKAYEEFLKEKEEDDLTQFYCVGHSVIRYYLNGNLMGNLEGHKAKLIGEDLIATFLPEDVVDGLYKAVELAGLSVANMTLEPIAAIQVAIPERFRMLNIALIDVGAGTSDISITNDGCILAYGMIPMAGDVLTEEIARSCLVDFQTAEQIKREAGEKETIEYQDIMFLPQTITREEVLKITDPLVENMAGLAADKIKELNGDKSVSAVFVVGGGGKIPGYTESVAEHLGIAKERVALRGEEVMGQIDFEEDIKKDSLLVTPVGICLNFYEQSNNFIFVSFNESKIKIYDNNRLTVGDAAMQAGFPNDGLFPKRGKALTFTLNGESRMIRGGIGEAAQIFLNGSMVDLNAAIHANDVIRVIPSTAGPAAKGKLADLKEMQDQLTVFVNDQKIMMPRFASVNGVLQSEYYEIMEKDQIEMLNYCTVGQLVKFMDLNPFESNIYVNNVLANTDTQVYENFSVKIETGMPGMANAETVSASAESTGTETTGVSASAGTASTNAENTGTGMSGAGTSAGAASTDAGSTEAENQETAKPIQDLTVTINHKPVTLRGKSSYVYVDVFDVIDFDLSKPRGKGIVTTLNGKAAQYMEEIHDGDVIEIYWQE